ncbi:MAG: DNA recombination protein RmuC [Verrucomicrobiales bacterium]|nr:DNA recombination protein RmuC [Verrucomicrobiales bacterium]MCP5526442.1 DNA recombination protein RmuC [Verrucomicrobiales bacterium]
MNTPEFLVLVAVMLAGFGLLGWLVHRRDGRAAAEAMAGRLVETRDGLESLVRQNHTDLATRIEQVKGELRADLAERLQAAAVGTRDVLARELGEGRAEQGRRLGETSASIEQKFERLRETIEGRLDAVARRQGESAREAREELARTLTETAASLLKRVEGMEQRTGAQLEQIRSRVDERLEAINQQVQQKLEKNIQEGFAHFQKVQEHLRAAEEQLRNVGVVGNSINELNSLLKLPHLRGRFGEAELGRLLADFLPASAYTEQCPVVPGSREAVDAVVRFPNYVLPIDSKFNREQILPLFESSDPAALAEARKQLSSAVRQQARSISEKYIHPEQGTTDLALMFLPSETLYFEVIRDGALTEALHKLKVFPVSPNTLAITLRTVAMSISQYEFARNVEGTLREIRRAQDSFGHFQRRFEEVGRGLERAQEAYQTATGHLNRYANRVVRLAGDTDLPLAEPGAEPENAPPSAP